MSQAEAPLSTESLLSELPRTAEPEKTFSIPGKVFLMGEYAVLTGLPAVLAEAGPRFQVELKPELPPGSEGSSFHELSPAGKLLARVKSVGVSLDPILFTDPHQGAGGFGASTAQFIAVYRALAPRMSWGLDWKSCWTLYREITQEGLPEDAIPPSGADLVAQWEGGVIVFDPSSLMVQQVAPGLDPERCQVFSAAHIPGRKVATHGHLKELAESGMISAVGRGLKKPLLDGIVALKSGDLSRLGRAMCAYADVLASHGLENEDASRDREALNTIAGVAGVKGAGALQSDAIIVILDDPEVLPEVMRVAQSLGLRPV